MTGYNAPIDSFLMKRVQQELLKLRSIHGKIVSGNGDSAKFPGTIKRRPTAYLILED